MKFCVECLYPQNHPLGLVLDDSGVCSGCRVHREKDQIDWTERASRLRAIFDDYRNRKGGNYDCIVPVSGAQDSRFIVDLVKNTYGMNPLLVSYNRHFNSPEGIRNLQRLREDFDCDHISLTLDPNLIRRITRETLSLRGSMYWHCLAGQSVFPVRAAVGYKVPLIVWGAHQGCDQAGMYSHHNMVEMSRRYRHEHDLMGLEAEDILRHSNRLSAKELEPLMYPPNIDIESVGVRGIYLSNFVRWDSLRQHKEIGNRFNYEGVESGRSFDRLNHADCIHYLGLHDYIKFLKTGYSKVTDHAVREIRLGFLTRDEGIRAITQYTQQPVQDLERFCSWIGMSACELMGTLAPFVNRDVWEQTDFFRFRLRHAASEELLELNQQVDLGSDPRLYNRADHGELSSPLFLRGYNPTAH